MVWLIGLLLIVEIWCDTDSGYCTVDVGILCVLVVYVDLGLPSWRVFVI